MTMNPNIIEIKQLKTYLGGAWVHKDINLDVKKGEILVIVGGSGTGKTVLLGMKCLPCVHPRRDPFAYLNTN